MTEKRTCITERCNVTATNVIAGQIIDVEILTKYCICSNINDEEHEHGCLANYSGACGGVEVEGVRRIFEISQCLYDIHYKNYYLWDKDTKSYKTVLDADLATRKTMIGRLKKMLSIFRRNIWV